MQRFDNCRKLKLLFILLLCLSQTFCFIHEDYALPPPPIRDFSVAGENEAWIVTKKGKVFHFLNGGQTREDVKFSTKIVQIYFLNASEGWTIGADGQVWATSNGGKDWQKRAKLVEEKPASHSTQLVFADQQTGWLLGAFTVWMTGDGGNSWTMVYPTAEFDYGTLSAQPTHYFPVNADEGWMSMTNSKVLKTTNRGKSWEIASVPGNSDIYSLYARSKNECFVPAFTGSEIYYTNDGGKNWRPSLSASERGEIGIYSIAFPTPEIGWGVGIEFVKDINAPKKLNGVVLKTTDGGKSWRRLKDEFYKNEFRKIKFTGANNGWLISEKSLYRTTDGGENWTKTFEEN